MSDFFEKKYLLIMLYFLFFSLSSSSVVSFNFIDDVFYIGGGHCVSNPGCLTLDYSSMYPNYGSQVRNGWYIHPEYPYYCVCATDTSVPLGSCECNADGLVTASNCASYEPSCDTNNACTCIDRGGPRCTCGNGGSLLFNHCDIDEKATCTSMGGNSYTCDCVWQPDVRYCGDFIINTHDTIDGFVEECDSGSDMNFYGQVCPRYSSSCTVCNESCQIVYLDPEYGWCKDGIKQSTYGEQCDDGNSINTDNCTNDCKLNVCGDGYVRSGVEQCDDKNSINTDSCKNDCTLNVCGDGYVRSGVEQCDNGNQSQTFSTSSSMLLMLNDGISTMTVCGGDASLQQFCKYKNYDYASKGSSFGGSTCLEANAYGTVSAIGNTYLKWSFSGDTFYYVTCYGTSYNTNTCDNSSTSCTYCSTSCINTTLVSAEICDNKDNDLDGLIDAADPDLDCCTNSDCTGGQTCNTIDHLCKSTYYFDWDGDGYGLSTSSFGSCNTKCGIGGANCNSVCCTYPSKCNGTNGCCDFANPISIVATSPPTYYSATSVDCNDANASIKPNAVETCNGVDDDCAGGVDNGLTPPSRVCTAGIGACLRSGTEYKTCLGTFGWSTTYSGCTAVAGSPVAETCNGVDDNCDTVVDNIVPANQTCTIANGTGNQTRFCSGSTVTTGTCTVTSCNSGYHIKGNACVEDCKIPSVTVAPGTGCIGNDCSDTDQLNLQFTYVGDCTDAKSIQIDLKSADSTCSITANGPQIVGISKSYPTGLTGSPQSLIFTLPNVPPACDKKTLTYVDAALRNTLLISDSGTQIIGTYTGSHTISSNIIQLLKFGCGNGKLETGEQCDLGVLNSNTGTCTTSCNLALCGDGYTQPSNNEQCDDANFSNTDLCNNSCKFTSCGDNIIQSPNYYGINENCDLGAANTNTACVPAYGFNCSYCPKTGANACKNQSLVGPYCGDGIINGVETCDRGALNTDIACTIGYNLNCSYCPKTGANACKNQSLVGPYCGDNNIDYNYNETCDNGSSNGNDAACSKNCRINCYISNVTISNSTGCTGYNCHTGDTLSVKVTYSPYCSNLDITRYQVDFFNGATPATSSCVIQRTGGQMAGITVTSLSVDPLTTFDYYIPSIPVACAGIGLKTVSMALLNSSGALMTPDNPAYSTHVYYNKPNNFTAPIVMSTSCEGYVQYNASKNFSEFKNFYVPNGSTIRYVCDGNAPRVAVTTAVPPGLYPSPKVVVGTSSLPVCYTLGTQSTALATRFCVEKNVGYTDGFFVEDGASMITLNTDCALWTGSTWINSSAPTNKTIKCIKYDADSVNGQSYAVYLNISSLSSPNIICSNVSDGICPNDFSTLPLCGDATLGYTDVDCGHHEFVKCLPIIDVDGQNTGNDTCANQAIANIKPDSWCALQGSLTNITKLHTQCVGGAVVQDPTTGCPKCLMPGEEVVYTGVTKSVPTRANPLNIVTENMTLIIGNEFAIDGKYYTCPSKKYDAIKVSNVLQCKARADKCDEGYRSLTTNNLQFGCDKPANFTGGKWVLNTNCLYKVGSQYRTYCGLNSWYKNYEIYDDGFNITII